MGAAQRSAVIPTPWRLRDYDPSPAAAAQLPHGFTLGQPADAQTLHPSPLSQQQQQGQPADAHTLHPSPLSAQQQQGQPAGAHTPHPSPLSAQQQQGDGYASDDDGGADYGGYSGGCAFHSYPTIYAAVIRHSDLSLYLCQWRHGMLLDAMVMWAGIDLQGSVQHGC